MNDLIHIIYYTSKHTGSEILRQIFSSSQELASFWGELNLEDNKVIYTTAMPRQAFIFSRYI